LDTISLQFKNKSPLADISKLLNDIHSELVTQQQNSDMEAERMERECTKQLNEYNGRIDSATHAIQESMTTVAGLKKRIKGLQDDVNNRQGEIKLLAQKDQEMREIRKIDSEDFANRVQQSRAVIGALDQIVPELERLKPHGNKKAAMAELRKIGGTNPIAAFIQVATTFDEAALQRVIQRLQKLKESLLASIEEDNKAELESKKNNAKLIGEMENARTNLEGALSSSRSELEEAKQTLENQKRILRENQKELDISTKGKQQLIGQCDDKRSRSRSEKSARDGQVKIIEKVQQIIASRLDSMQDYVKDRNKSL
jgi:chromosome segregation ATPase